MMNKTLFIVSATALIGLSACTDTRPVSIDDLNKPHFWQRANTTDAIYQRGPKAQQMLHRDISRCVVELNELENLGTLRNAIPGDHSSYTELKNPKGARADLEDWETPDREGAMYAEHGDYYDFESCMNFKGWERVENVPYDVATESRDVYIETILRKDPEPVSRKKHSTSSNASSSTTDDEDFQELND